MDESWRRVNNNKRIFLAWTKLLQPIRLLCKLRAMSTNSILSEQVAAKKSEISQALRRVEVLRAELATLEKVVRLLGIIIEAENTTSRKEKSHSRESVRGTVGLSISSKIVLAAMADDSEKNFDYEALLRVSEDKGLPTTNSTLRSQMMNLKRRGLVEPVSYGKYRITKLGVEEARQLQFNSPEQAPSMDQQEGEVSQQE